MNCERLFISRISMNLFRPSLNPSRFRGRARACCAVLAFQLATGSMGAQVSQSAYRALGQADLRRNALNSVQGNELYNPQAVAVDSRNGQSHLYIADSANSRVLAWADLNSYQIGDAPALILGQPGPQYANPLGIGTKGFNGPFGLAVDPTNGNLYIADTGDNRVLRYVSPFDNPTRIEPDAVYGQASFTTRTPGSISPTAMNTPRGLTVDSAGNLWVSDTGNHRVLRFAAATLNSAAPVAADTVIGQKDFFSGGANANGNVSALAFDTPIGLAFDSSGNLYVADFRNARVLRFQAPLGAAAGNPAANGVWGQSNFASKGVPQQPSASSIAGPQAIAIDGAGNLYVTDLGDNRVLVFPLGTSLGATAKSVIGQSDFVTSTPNTGVAPLASPNTLSGVTDVKVDPSGNIFVADTGNNRVLQFPAGSKSASKVWGQTDFVANGANQIKPGSINLPYGVAIDYSSTPYALYVADTGNNRVLIWKDSVRFRNGDPADMVIGQPSLRSAIANVDTQGAGASRTSLSAPTGLAINRSDGTLYVADSGNNRVLRFSRPVSQSGRIAPDAVIGQVDFTSSASAAVSGASLNSPGGLAIGPTGDLFVADSGNNRVLEYAAGAGNGSSAIRVYGQPSMTTAVRQTQVSAQSLSTPQSIAVDQASSLYVADAGANRVLIFPTTQNQPPAGATASFVIGQSSFGNSAVNGLRSPLGVTLDSIGNIYVADSGNNRVLAYPSLVFLPVAAGSPSSVVGQQTAGGSTANWDSTDGLATPNGLAGPVGVYIDRQDTLYVSDAVNHRVVQFLKPAAVVNAATFQASVPVAPGGLATLFSNGLASDKTLISSTTWPNTASNRQLVINDQLAAPIYYIDGNQVNFQVPSNAPVGSNRIAVRVADTGELVAGGSSLLVGSASPGIFTATQNGAGQALVLNQDNTINSSSNPANQGSIVVLYGTGQGQVSPAVPDGTAAPTGTLSNTVAVPTSDQRTCLTSQPSMCVAFGNGILGDIKFSGLAPGYIGLWQINVAVPSGLTGTAVPVRIIINGTPSNTVTIGVR
jgi:uncharacterized protein (TIGR03437 family)